MNHAFRLIIGISGVIFGMISSRAYALSLSTPAMRAADLLQLAVSEHFAAGGNVENLTPDRTLQFLNQEELKNRYKDGFLNNFQFFSVKRPRDPKFQRDLFCGH